MIFLLPPSFNILSRPLQQLMVQQFYLGIFSKIKLNLLKSILGNNFGIVDNTANNSLLISRSETVMEPHWTYHYNFFHDNNTKSQQEPAQHLILREATFFWRLTGSRKVPTFSCCETIEALRGHYFLKKSIGTKYHESPWKGRTFRLFQRRTK